MALFTDQDLVNFLGDPDLDTERVELARSLATGMIEAHTNQRIERQNYTHLLPVVDGVVTLPQRPVISVAEVLSMGDPVEFRFNLTPWLLVDNTLDKVQVTYEAGWDPVPNAVKAVALGLASRIFTSPSGVKTERIDDYQVTYEGAKDGLTLQECKVLNRYRASHSTVVPS